MIQATRLALILMAVLCAAPGRAQTPPPSATTATFGDWTVGCTTQAQADGSPPRQLCEMTTRLTLKGQDGQNRPLLQWSIGQPPGSPGLRLALQLPTAVALRAGVAISLDKPASASPKPQEDLAALTYLTCTAQGCLADAEAPDAVLARLKAAKTANVAFTLMQGAKRVMVPVSLDGFSAALAALQANKS